MEVVNTRTLICFGRKTGVAQKTTEAGNQAGNCKAERMHRTVVNMVRCMIFSSDLPLSFWGDAAKYAAYVLNRMPNHSNTERASPVEMLSEKRPSLVDIVAFGSKCDVFPDRKNDSLKRRSENVIILGKNDKRKAFACGFLVMALLLLPVTYVTLRCLLTLTISTWRIYYVQRMRVTWKS